MRRGKQVRKPGGERNGIEKREKKESASATERERERKKTRLFQFFSVPVAFLDSLLSFLESSGDSFIPIRTAFRSHRLSGNWSSHRSKRERAGTQRRSSKKSFFFRTRVFPPLLGLALPPENRQSCCQELLLLQRAELERENPRVKKGLPFFTKERPSLSSPFFLFFFSIPLRRGTCPRARALPCRPGP